MQKRRVVFVFIKIFQSPAAGKLNLSVVFFKYKSNIINIFTIFNIHFDCIRGIFEDKSYSKFLIFRFGWQKIVYIFKIALSPGTTTVISIKHPINDKAIAKKYFNIFVFN